MAAAWRRRAYQQLSSVHSGFSRSSLWSEGARILEAQDKEQGRLTDVVPDAWIAGATHGLFARSSPRDDDHATMEALGSLLNFAAEAEIGPGGTKLKLTKRGINQLRRKGLVAGDEE
jgi:hypothetical protein